ncbi:MAG: YihA family ribosome biogenesis GTP-binding protein [Bacteroidales bacterium]|jgi:GTP-binding protein|nr:YihA family ribosome biogenesis GTP-binding protein [Bacteroidales bacterium]
MDIKTATFTVSNSTYKKCPKPDRPEYAFIGRSNVGKSSLINMLVGNKSLAKTGSNPGKTQLINHFEINNSWYLVDLPGYGYARISKTSREKWSKMIQDYLLYRENLMNVFLLIDSRIPPQAIDLDFITFLGSNGIPFSIVFTKIDKGKQREVEANIAVYKKRLLESWEELPTIIKTSSVTHYGKDHILTVIEQINPLFEQKETK